MKHNNNNNKPPLESLILWPEIKPWAFGVRVLTLDYQRTPNPREYQVVRTPTKATTVYKNRYHPSSGNIPCKHLIQKTSKTKTQTKSSTDRITSSLSPAHQRKKKKKKKKTTTFTSSQGNTSAGHTLREACANHWTRLLREETKRKKEFSLATWEKETSNTISLNNNNNNNNNEKAERTVQIEEQPRNTQVQINEEEIGKLP